MKRSVAVIIGLLVLSGVVASFWQLDFRAARSLTTSKHQLSTATSTQKPEQIPTVDRLAIAVGQRGEQSLTPFLAEALLHRFRTDFSDGATRYQAETEQAGFPLLRIEIMVQDVKWTPVNARAQVTVSLVYGSDGDVSWRNDPTLIIQSGEPLVRARGEIQVTDRTQGVISRRAYQKHLAQQIAAEIYKAMQQPLLNPGTN